MCIRDRYDALQSGGAYGNQSDIATGGTGGYWMMTEMRSDNTDQGAGVTGLAAAVAELNEFAETSLSEYTLGAWSGSYQGVARANTLITRIQSAKLDDAFKNQVVGEVLRKGYKLEDRLIRPAMVKVQSE